MPNPLYDWDPLTIDTTRRMIHGAVEETIGEGVNVTRPDADTLIAQAQALNVAPIHLRNWIYEHHPTLGGADGDWSAAALEAWTRKNGFVQAQAPERLGWSQRGDVVTLRMTADDYQRFMILLGILAGQSQPEEFWPFIALCNRLNEGNPEFQAYAIPQGKA